MSDDPASTGNPYTSYRRVTGGDGYFYLGGAYTTYVVARVFPGASGFGLWEQVDVKAQIDNGVIKGVTANGLQLQGAPLDLRNSDPRIDATAGSWRSGQWFANLVIQSSEGENMRVCWNVHLPPPPPVTGPPGFDPVVREPAFKRLMCGIYPKAGGRDVGGYVADDYAGDVRTFSGSW